MHNASSNGYPSGKQGVNDFAEWLANDSGKTQNEQKTIIERIVDFINEVIDKISTVLKGSGINSTAARTALEMEEKQAKEIRTAFLSLLENASDNYKSGQKNNTTKSNVNYIAFSMNVENKSAKELLDLISDNYDLIKKSRQIYNIDKDVLEKKHTKTSENILEYFDSIGNVVNNPEIGVVELVKSGAKTTVTKGFSDKKASAVGAIKDVIENGIIIDRQKQWKGRGYDTVVLAGRGMLYDEDSIIGVVVKTYPDNKGQNSKFYLHEIIEIKEVDLYKQTAPQLSVDAEHKSTSINSISNSNENVKNSNS